MLFDFILLALIVNAVCDDKDGGKAPRIPLNDGNAIPAMGLGTFLGFDENGQKEVKDREVEEPVTWALNAGYRFPKDGTVKGEWIKATGTRES